MKKHKKKAVTQEKYSLIRATAKNAMLAGALLLSGAYVAGAAPADIANQTDWNSWVTGAASDTAGAAINPGAAAAANITINAGATAVTSTGPLSIAGNNSKTATLIINGAGIAFATATIGGGADNSAAGTLQINGGKTFAGVTTVNAYGNLVLAGTETAGAVHTGNVTLNDANARLMVTGGSASSMNTLTGNFAITTGKAFVGQTSTMGDAGFLRVTGNVSVANTSENILDVGTNANGHTQAGGNGIMHISGSLNLAGSDAQMNIGGAGGNASGTNAGKNGGTGKVTVDGGIIGGGFLYVGGKAGASATAKGGMGGAGILEVTGGLAAASLNVGGSGNDSAGGIGGQGFVKVTAGTADTAVVSVRVGGFTTANSAGNSGEITITSTTGAVQLGTAIIGGEASGAGNAGAGVLNLSTGSGAVTLTGTTLVGGNSSAAGNGGHGTLVIKSDGAAANAVSIAALTIGGTRGATDGTAGNGTVDIYANTTVSGSFKAGGQEHNGGMGVLSLYGNKTLTLGTGGSVGGASGTSNGIISLADGAKISAASQTITFGATSTLTINNAHHYGTNFAITGDTVSVSDGAKLIIHGGKAGTVIKVADATTFTAESGANWSKGLSTTSNLLKVSGAVDSNKYTVSIQVDAGKIPYISSSMAGLINNMGKQFGVDTDSSNAGVRFISRAADNAYLDKNQAAATIEGAAQLATVGAVQGTTLGAMNTAAAALTARTSFASPLGTNRGMSSGSATNALGVWFMPLYQNERVHGMKSGHFKTGYKSNLGGAAIGADYTINETWRMGVALNAGGGKASSSGAFSPTKNNFNFWGASFYGSFAQSNYSLTGDIGYTGSRNRVSQHTNPHLGFSNLHADVDGSAISVGLRGEYKYRAASINIVPHAGARYTALITNGYRVKSSMGNVFHVERETQNIFTIPVGVALSTSMAYGNWTISPMLDLGFITAMGSLKSKSRVGIPGVSGNATLESQVVDRLTFDGTLGVEAKHDKVSLGLNYNLQTSGRRTAHGVFATFRYAF